mgnify:CR=1 FL=1
MLKKNLENSDDIENKIKILENKIIKNENKIKNYFLDNSNDLCKVGLLILNNGKYNKKQILQASLIDKMIHPYIDKKKIISDEMWKNTDMNGYGLMWWRYKHLIIAQGYLGQMLIIDKKNNLQSKGAEVKTRWVLHLKDIKNVEVKDAFPASKPRYSYWTEKK